MASEGEPSDDGHSAIFRKLQVFESRAWFVVVGVRDDVGRYALLQIGRKQPESSVVQKADVCTKADVQAQINALSTPDDPVKLRFRADALLGIVSFFGHYHMLFVTRSDLTARIAGHPIYVVRDTLLLPLPDASWQAQVAGNKDAARFRQLFRGVDLAAGDFYFSFTYDLTRSLQSNTLRAHGAPTAPPCTYNGEFAWNFYLAQTMLDALDTASEWIVPLVHGFCCQVPHIDVNGQFVEVTLLARRSRHCAGTRYNRRGMSPDGHVANSVESELIVAVKTRDRLHDPRGRSMFSSVVFVRGSIPLFWCQIDPFQPRPEIRISKREPKFDTTKAHFGKMAADYGTPITVVSLIKKKETTPQETVVGTMFEEALAALADTNQFGQHALLYKSYDLLQARERQEPVITALTSLFSGMELAFTFFAIGDLPHLYRTGDHRALVPDSVQAGVLRVNCIDCLDRTNIAQFCFAKVVVTRMLFGMDVIDAPDGNLSEWAGLDKALRDMFVEHGDQIALQYAGSGAMHKDALQQDAAGPEQHSTLGSIGNAITAVRRYYSNAVTDAEKQYAINVFLGDIMPEEKKVYPWAVQGPPAPTVGDCTLKYGNVADRWVAVFTLPRSPYSARRLQFAENYMVAEMTSFFQLDADYRPGMKPAASPRNTPTPRRLSASDLGGTEFFEKTLALERSLNTPSSQGSPMAAEQMATAVTPAVARASATLDNAIQRMQSGSSASILSLAYMPRIDFYERYVALEDVSDGDDPDSIAKWRRATEERLARLEQELHTSSNRRDMP